MLLSSAGIQWRCCRTDRLRSWGSCIPSVGGLLGVFGEGTLSRFEAGTCQHEGLGLGAELSATYTTSQGQDVCKHTLAESVAVAIESREVDRKVV